MAIDFSQVKTITIPEGSVTKITDSTGNTLWQGVGWHTIWEGNKRIGYRGYFGSELLFATVPYSESLILRISFSDMATCDDEGDPIQSFFTPSDKKSPSTINSFGSTQTYLVESYGINSSRNANAQARVVYNKNNGKIYGVASSYPIDTTYARAWVTISKIEAYY